MAFPEFQDLAARVEASALPALVVCLGPDLAGRLRTLRALGKTLDNSLLRRLWEARRALAREALAAVDFGPATFAPVTEGTALSGDPRFATTPAEWLGPFLAGPAGP
jgi:hypothetical protein